MSFVLSPVIESIFKHHHLTEELKADFLERDALGWKRYGVPFTANNGRDAKQELREELLDAVGYAEQLRIEGKVSVSTIKAIQRALLAMLQHEELRA